LEGEINKLRAQLADSHVKIESFKGCEPHEVEEMKTKWKAEKERFEAYVVELEGKLEREVLLREEKVKVELEERVGDVMRGGAVSPVKSGKKKVATGVKGGKLSVVGVGVGGENKRIKELEKLVVELQERLLRATKGARNALLSDLMMSSSKPTIEENTYIRHLKERVSKLENEVVQVEKSWEDRLKTLQSEVITFKVLLSICFYYETERYFFFLEVKQRQSALRGSYIRPAISTGPTSSRSS
jgi:hypothetical protein